MRTRIALMAVASTVAITGSTLGASAQATTSTDRPARSDHHHVARLDADRLRPGRVADDGAPGGPATVLGPLLRLDALLPATPPPAPTPAPAPRPPQVVDTVTPLQRAAWDRVAVCEEGGDWQADGGRFSGGLGITRTNWVAFGGLQYAPEGSEATPDEQIMVAERIQADPPDQDGCAGW
jgi:hypothetical protein